MIDVVARMFYMRDKLVEKDERKDETVRNLWNLAKPSEKNSNAAEDKGARVRLLSERKDETFRTDMYEHLQQNGDIDMPFPIRCGLTEDIRIIREILEKYQDKQKKNEIKDKHIREWRVISCITDRLFFSFYLIINVVGVVFIFFIN